jgi:hypothetical protein
MEPDMELASPVTMAPGVCEEALSAVPAGTRMATRLEVAWAAAALTCTAGERVHTTTRRPVPMEATMAAVAVTSVAAAGTAAAIDREAGDG